MRASNSLVFSIAFILLSTFTAAWPWPRWLPELDALVPRQDNSDTSEGTTATSARVTATSTNEDSTITSKPTTTGTSNSEETNTKSSGTSKQTGTNSDETTEKSGSKKTSATKSRTTSYDARLPAGGVAMVTPAVIDGAQYFKVGEYVTFKWNYTSLKSTPTAVNILASVKANNAIYTLASNQTVTNATQALTWDTGSYQETNQANPLLTAEYTLIIYDAAGSVSDTSQAGYLAVFNQYTFGMYTPQPYTPLGEFICATCSGALSDGERNAIRMLVGVSVITVLSFTWFVGGTGVIW